MHKTLKIFTLKGALIKNTQAHKSYVPRVSSLEGGFFSFSNENLTLNTNLNMHLDSLYAMLMQFK